MQLGPAVTQTVHSARPEVVNEHIGPFQQPVHDSTITAIRQVELDAPFAPVQPDEVRRLARHDGVVMARKVTTRPLNLDHIRPKIGQVPGAERSRDRLFESDDSQSSQRAGQALLIRILGGQSYLYTMWYLAPRAY